MINKHLIIGRLGQDAEIRTTTSGKTVATFSVATSQGYKDASGNWKDKTSWHRIVLWNPSEYLINSLKKGTLVYIEGAVETRSYEDSNGDKRYITETVASLMRVLDKKQQNEQEENDGFPF